MVFDSNKLLRFILAAYFLAFLCFVGYSQTSTGNAQQKNDTLDWGKASELTEMHRLMDIGWDKHLYANPDSAVYCGKRALEIAVNNGHLEEQLNCKRLIAVAESIKGNLFESSSLLQEAISQARDLGQFQVLSALLNSYGIVLTEAGDYQGAVEVLMESIKLDEQFADTLAQAGGWNNVGLIHYDLIDFEDAKKCFERSISLYTAINQPEKSINALSNLGMVLSNELRFDEALTYYRRAQLLAQEHSNERGLIMSLANIGGVYFETEQFEEANSFLNEAESRASNYGDAVLHATILLMQSKVEAGKRNFDNAIRLNLRALEVADDIGVMHIQQQATDYLSRYYRSTGRYKEALESFERSAVLRDSITAESNRQEAMSQQFHYTFEKREALLVAEQEKKEALAAIELRRQQTQRNASIGGFALTLILALVFFSQRLRIAKEKRRSEELLLNILPAETAEELKATGTSPARHIDQVTVLFTDFNGFTQLSEQLTPEALVEMINECFSRFDQITEKYGIEKIKTIGDAYMAAGGLPSPNTTHAEDVVNAALEIQAYMEELKALRSEKKLPYFEIRIGIHTGSVVAGIVGFKKIQYDIWGDTVNTAARMESSSEIGQINISDATWKRINTQFETTYRGEIQAKGKGPMGMYFVNGPKV